MASGWPVQIMARWSHAEEKAEAVSCGGSGQSHGSRTNRDAAGRTGDPRPQKDEKTKAPAEVRRLTGWNVTSRSGTLPFSTGSTTLVGLLRRTNTCRLDRANAGDGD